MAKLTVKEFAALRGRSTQGIYQLMKRHEKEMRKHIRKDGGRTVIDEQGQELLDGWSEKIQQPNMAIVDARPLNELQEAKDKILQLTEEKAELQGEIIRLQNKVAGLLEVNSALQIQLLGVKTPEPAADPEGTEAKTEPEAEGSQEEKREDPEGDPAGKIEKPEEEQKPEKRKGFFARLFGF
ncbi:MAG: hypothetical protein IJ153_10565 [Clostridia bacterium]|nr:hypothetical protein [Clostridia bacterium]